MGRPKSFQEEETLRLAAQAFAVGGYEGTSVDDLVKALNLHRGSLYKAFGSKRGLFLAVLSQYVQIGLGTAIQNVHDDGKGVDLFEALTNSSDIDLLLIAALERGHQDPEVASLVRKALGVLEDVLHGDIPLSDNDVGPPVERLTSRILPAQAIRLMGARLYERLRVDVEDPDSDPQ